MKKHNLLHLLIIFSCVLINFNALFSQSKEFKKLDKYFSSKKWDDYEKLFDEIVIRYKVSFKIVIDYKGSLNNQKFWYYSTTDTFFQTKRHTIQRNKDELENYRKVLVLSYMFMIKAIELQEAERYPELLSHARNAYLLSLLKVSCGFCDYKETFLKLNIHADNGLRFAKVCDSLVIENAYNSLRYNAANLNELRTKLNTVTFYPLIDNYIRIKEEDDAISTNDVKELAKILKKYPTSPRFKEILSMYDDNYFSAVKQENNINAYKDYLKVLPDGKHTTVVKSELEKLHIATALNSNDILYIQQVIRTYRKDVDLLNQRIEKIEFDKAKSNGIKGIREFMEVYPNSIYVQNAKDEIANFNFQKALEKRDVLTLMSYLNSNPNHPQKKLIEQLFNDAETLARNIKKYSGKYCGGIAVFEYYTDLDGNEVLHGGFEFQKTDYSRDLEGPYQEIKLDFLNIPNFPYIVRPSGFDYDDDNIFKLPNFIRFLGVVPTGKFKGTFKHGKKDGAWKYENFNRYSENREVMILSLKNDSLISAKYSMTNKRINGGVVSCFNCSHANADLTPLGFEGEFQFINLGRSVIGQYVKGEKHGVWKIKDSSFDPGNFNPNQLIGYDLNSYSYQTFDAEITLEFAFGKLVSKVIRNLDTRQIYTEETDED